MIDEEALAALRAGGIVCIPTESSYGLAVDASNDEALVKLVLLKDRSTHSAFGLIAGSLTQAQSYCTSWPTRAQELAALHWPGPLTLVLPPRPAISPHLLGSSGRVALRVSSEKRLRDLALALGNPITATSANPRAKEPAVSVAQANAYFGALVSHYLEGGDCYGEPSTLVDFDTAGNPIVLRQGPIRIDS